MGAGRGLGEGRALLLLVASCLAIFAAATGSCGIDEPKRSECESKCGGWNSCYSDPSGCGESCDSTECCCCGVIYDQPEPTAEPTAEFTVGPPSTISPTAEPTEFVWNQFSDEWGASGPTTTIEEPAESASAIPIALAVGAAVLTVGAVALITVRRRRYAQHEQQEQQGQPSPEMELHDAVSDIAGEL
jgi:hypothetical protein